MFSKSALSIAVLSAANVGQLGYAVLTAELSEGDDWKMLLPDGEFSAVDGRPHDVPGGKWRMNAEVAERLIAKAALRQNDLVIDYEHQTLNAATTGIPAPAAGFFREFQYQPGKGLYVKPLWTPRAQGFVDAKEYRYLSAVFPYDTTTGEPTEILMAALTNNPGAIGMEALASLVARFEQPTHGDKPMSDLLIQLMAKLGITLKPGDNLTDEQAQAALTAVTHLQGSAGCVAALTAKIETLESAGAGNVDLSQYVPIAQYNAALTQVAALTATTASLTVEQVIAQAEQDGKLILASEKDYLVSLGKQNMAALTAQLAARPVVAALTAKQTEQRKAPDTQDKSAVASLTADQKLVADQIGISHAELAQGLGA